MIVTEKYNRAEMSILILDILIRCHNIERICVTNKYKPFMLRSISDCINMILLRSSDIDGVLSFIHLHIFELVAIQDELDVEVQNLLQLIHTYNIRYYII